MRPSLSCVVLLSLCQSVISAPAPSAVPSPAPTTPAHIEDRDLISDVLGDVGDVTSDLNKVLSDLGAGSLVGTAGWSAISSALVPITATKTQTNAASAISTLSAIHAAKPSANLYEFIASIVAEGLTTDSVADALQFVDGILTGENNMNNVNTRNPATPVYPQKACGDAPYSLDEGALRAAIYIPSTFTYGKVPPVILVPGTGNTGYITFQGNFIQLLTGTSYADPVWLNIPGYLLGDAQINAEYVAYAMNYITGISDRNASVIAWSQGNIDTQWAFKYWPSTRKVISNHIAISPDYAGTVLADLVCPDGLPCDPSVLQQQYLGSSNFITTLRNNNGDSAYVPTTTLYSALFDEIVEPQAGTGASAYLNDARRVGVTNNEVQTVCAGLAGGSFYTHEGMLYNPLAFALAKDALTNGGPGQVSRIDTTAVCNQYLATGLNIGDFLLTENAVLVAGLALITYLPKATEEPAISGYALSSVSTCKSSASSTKTSSTLSTKTSSTRTTITSSTKTSSKSTSKMSTSTKR
ncbi:hypothetical protein AAFC00_005631 [Neodothiora populina]|uniref:Alpha/beta-hydrolase n=1 Tax=Neodothiora populina TaxID=2781224 RepID=A0ABR3PLJ0_9PEZI